MSSSQSITSYKFGALELRVAGLGVYFGGPVLNAKVEALSPDEIRAANSAAWKQKRAAERRCERYANASIHTGSDYDVAHLHCMVAEAVCKATWARMRTAA